jgi:hypothetical protein
MGKKLTFQSDPKVPLENFCSIYIQLFDLLQTIRDVLMLFGRKLTKLYL